MRLFPKLLAYAVIPLSFAQGLAAEGVRISLDAGIASPVGQGIGMMSRQTTRGVFGAGARWKIGSVSHAGVQAEWAEWAHRLPPSGNAIDEIRFRRLALLGAWRWQAGGAEGFFAFGEAGLGPWAEGIRYRSGWGGTGMRFGAGERLGLGGGYRGIGLTCSATQLAFSHFDHGLWYTATLGFAFGLGG